MNKKRVAVLRGGPSSEYDVSMMTGNGVLKALSDLNYHVIDIPVTKQGEWLVDGKVRTPDQALAAADVAFIAMHGEYGEDGTIQRIFERLHLPFTGSNAFPSSVAFNKDLTKRTLANTGITMAKHVKIERSHIPQIEEIAAAASSAFGPEYVVKPSGSGSSVGVVMVGESDDLVAAIKMVLASFESCLVEERIRGVEATCAVLEDFRDTKLYILPPIEIVPPLDHDFFAADVKYTGATTEICPGRFSYEEKEKMGAIAALVHDTLGLSQYSRSDFMVRDGEVYFLEVNTLPGLTSESLFPKAAAAVGLSFTNLVEHLITTARVRAI